jgi:hypothetical protein
MTTTFRFIVSINTEDLPNPRPIDIYAAIQEGVARLEDPTDEDHMAQDLVLEWPGSAGVGTFQQFIEKYAGPLLSHCASLAVDIRGDQGSAGIYTVNADVAVVPVAWVKPDVDKLECEALAKLAAIREIVK